MTLEEMRSEEELKVQTAYLEHLLESAPQAIVINQEGRVTRLNREFTRLFGYTPKEALGRSLNELIVPADKIPEALSLALQVREGKVVSATSTRRRKDHSLVDVSVRCAPIYLGEDRIAVYSMYRDITEQKQAQDALRLSEERFRTVVENALDIITILDPSGTILFESPSVETLFGYRPEEMMGWNAFSLVHPEDLPQAQKVFRRAMAVPGTAGSAEFRFRHKDGSWRLLEGVGQTVVDASGAAQFLVISRDITQRRRAEEALRHSEAKYRSLVESAVHGIFRSTLEGNILAANPALVAMLGYDSEEEVLALNLARDVYADPRERQRIVENARKESGEQPVEVQWRRRDGKQITVRLSGRVVVNEQGQTEGFETIAEDVTERRLLESQLRQAQKMEAVGRLAGGIAHDFNNLLTVIQGYSDVLLEEMQPDQDSRAKLEEVIKASQRASALTRQLLAFSRQQVLAPKVLDLNAVVASMERLLRPLLGEDVQLITRSAPDLGSVKADPGQIEQVVMNLAVNARDAMPKGGRLTIKTANADLDYTYARDHVSVRPGRYVMLAVSDTGHGMDAETRARIFEPFFTTKEQGRGTGLGLSTVYGIVKQSDGYIWAYSEPGMGTTFKVYLPRVDEAAEPLESRRLEPVAQRASEAVLVVEDEEGVRMLACDILRKHGYAVLEAPSGDAALNLWQQLRAPLDLLLTDVILGSMSGRELAERLRPLCPRMKVLYMSGYTDDAIFHRGALTPDTAFLQKPFSKQSLLGKVREALAPKANE